MEHQLQALTKDKETGQYVLPSGYEARQLIGGYHLVPTKSAAGGRVLVLSPGGAAALVRWREEWTRNEWGLVFPNSKGGPRSDRADRAEWAELQTRAKRGRALSFYIRLFLRGLTDGLIVEARVACFGASQKFPCQLQVARGA